MLIVVGNSNSFLSRILGSTTVLFACIQLWACHALLTIAKKSVKLLYSTRHAQNRNILALLQQDRARRLGNNATVMSQASSSRRWR